MENKYYTPEIEDLRVGYECQWNDLSIWRDEILDSYGLFATIINESNESLVDKIRTKHLDKQDIESLGWKFKGKSIDIWFEKEGDFDMGSFTTYKIIMHYGLEDHRMFIYADDQGTEYDLFKGEIKSINELKYIQKLLGIN